MNEIIDIILEIPKSPIVYVVLLMYIGESIFAFKVVNDLAKVLATVGIVINKEGKKKWRIFIKTLLTLVFIIFVFFLLFARLLV